MTSFQPRGPIDPQSLPVPAGKNLEAARYGISGNWSIDSDGDGLEIAYVLLNARAIDFAKFGHLFLNNGNWNGKQIIPARWVIESTTRDSNDNRPWKTVPAQLSFHPCAWHSSSWRLPPFT